MKKIYISLLFFCCFSMMSQTTEIVNKENTSSKINGGSVIARAPIDPIDPVDPVTPVKPVVPVNPTPNASSTEVGTTQGQLAVSLTGGATYSIPVAVPPGINGVVPQLSLNYNSQVGNGLAGYGWNISGISTISRIPSTKFHDGTIDAVDFDNLDRFAFDGQRLMLKSGAYGGNNTVYETESFSNIKITSYGTHPNGANFGPAYFIVEYPDGSKAYYGNSYDSRSITDWSITYWENPQGVRISYSYYNENNSLRISNINYGSLGATTPINQIQFIYRTRQRPEQAYIGGQAVAINSILSEIKVTGNGVGYRNYTLSHEITSLGYERLISITEKSGDNTKSYVPTTFGYDTTNSTIVKESIASTNISNISSLNSSTISGDYNGDGKMDFILYPTTGSLAKSKFSLFYDLKTQISNTSFELNTGVFEDIFTSSFLTGDNTTGYKLLPKQGWTVVKKNTAVNSYTFSNYSAEGGLNPIQLQYEKTFIFPGFSWSYFKVCGSYNYSNYTTQTYVIPKKFINGDFNGDGLTDVIAIENELYYTAACDRSGIRNGGQTFLVDLDKRNTSTTLINSGIIAPSSTNKYLVADFNGDGKSDLYVFNHQFFSVYSLNDNNQFEQLYASTNDSDLLLERPILMGDYNGDGKTDFLVPRGEGTNYAKYISTGTSYVKTYQVYPIQYTTPASYNYKQIIPNDINLDGKTDLIYAGSTNLVLPGYDYKYITVQNYKNNGDNFELESTFQTNNIDAVQAFAIPIFLNFDRNNPLIQINFISGNSIYNFTSTKDFSTEKLLKTISNGNKVKEIVTYSNMSLEPCSYNCKPIYTASSPTENYPNIDIQTAPGFKVVSKLEKQSATVYKQQLFAYHGAVSNLEGLGFLGFRATMRTNWNDDSPSRPIISTISKNDISRRGANIENYTVLYYASPSSSFAPTAYISKSVLDYTPVANILQPNKVFKLQNTKSIQFSGLDPSNTETITVYDSFSNPTSVTTTVKEGSTTVQTSVNSLTYVPANSSPYVIGRPATKTQTVTLSQTLNSTTSTETYTYTNHLLTQVEKSANAAPNKITETNTYDTFGNITKKSISVPVLAARETNYQYDSSGRFLIKSTDIEGLSTTFNYNTSNGLLTSETNPYSLTTSYFYDAWFKKTKTTDYLAKSKTISYARSGNNTTITADGDDGSQTVDYFDDLGRKYKSSTKDIGGGLSNVDYEYDIYDRNIKVSEPYYGSASQWSSTEFDVYGRTVKNTSFTGKTVNISYSGLTTTVDDGIKTKTSIKNAIGKVVSMTDNPGGTINYTYFANGNLKSSDYSGSTTTIKQDAWGRKEQLDDPSAGIYTYAYNTFGELTSEASPNGTTTYTLDNFGKLITKTIVGTSTDPNPNKFGTPTTNSKTDYTYDSTTKLLVSTVFTNNLEPVSNSKITTSYQYDSYKRLNKTVEDTPFATFTKQFTFDTFGRTDTEMSTALLKSNSKSSSKTIKNTYKNGFPWQILDNSSQQTVLWATNNVNARGQLIEASLGNGITIANTYDTYGLISQTQHNKGSVNTMTLNTVFDAQRGNLTSRTNNMFTNWSENFTYDQQDRLLSWKNDAGAIENQTYDNRGRIRSNALGDYAYENTAYRNSSIQLSNDAYNYYKSPKEQFISYTAFKSPVEIEEAGIDKVSFTYNDGNDRTAMFYGGLGTKETRRYRKYYSADGSMEIKLDTQNYATEFVTYIGGDGYSAPLLVKSDGITQNYLYLHRDYQGSILAITNQAGTIVEKRLFDAWGSLINYYNATGAAFGSWGAFDRGYTGHEHLTSVGLINMNARLYDPKLHRFLQPDNYIQEPFNTQNYNRYGYCWNNPLKFTDPSGEWIHLLIGAVVGGVMNWVAHGAQLNMNGLKAFGIGAAAGLIGAATGGAAFLAAGGGAAGAGGFLAGAFSGLVGATFSQTFLTVGNNIAFGDPLMSGKEFITGIAFGAILGGTINGAVAKYNGNTFWKGTPPRIAVEPISLPKIAGQTGTAEIKTGDYTIKSDVKLANTTTTTTGPTTTNNTAAAISNENGFVDVSNRREFGIKNYPPNNGAVSGTENLEYLQEGVKIDRYGSLNGTYASPSGTPLELRSLPPSNSGVLNSYEVIKPFPVQSSTISPWYNQPGGGIQYKLPKNINWLLENGFLKK
jgi:RHS repeat-associated protein